jgi:hypothetical protein
MLHQRQNTYFGVFVKVVYQPGSDSKKGVSHSLVCPICEHCNEDDWHVLMDCHDSILVRQIAGINGIITARCMQSAE